VRMTWARLQEYGVADGGELRLDFFYAAPTNAKATEIKSFLEEETHYEVQVTTDRDQWILRGHHTTCIAVIRDSRAVSGLDGDRGTVRRVHLRRLGAEAP
jgi:hypothetical protein